MSDAPHNITLERVNRLTQAVADLVESQAAQGRALTRLLTQTNEHLASIDTRLAELGSVVRTLASEQILLGNRVEEAFARALRVNVRLDEIEDRG
jgi:ABC-type transporter Mla subunit MlaD